jgi:hypothetical protein
MMYKYLNISVAQYKTATARSMKNSVIEVVKKRNVDAPTCTNSDSETY